MAANIPEFEVPDWMLQTHAQRQAVILLTPNLNFMQFYIYSANHPQRILCNHRSGKSRGGTIQDTASQAKGKFTATEITNYGEWCCDKERATYDSYNHKHYCIGSDRFFIVYI